MYRSGTTNLMYADGAGTTARNESEATRTLRSDSTTVLNDLELRTVVPGTSSYFVWTDRQSFAYPIRNTITFDTPGVREFTLDILPTQGVAPGWTRLALDAYASGREEIATGTTDGSGNLTVSLSPAFESVESVIVTPTANTNAWVDNFSSATSAVTLHTGTGSTLVSYRVEGY